MVMPKSTSCLGSGHAVPVPLLALQTLLLTNMTYTHNNANSLGRLGFDHILFFLCCHSFLLEDLHDLGPSFPYDPVVN